MGIKDSHELALQDWLGSRAVRPARGRRTSGRAAWAEAYVDFAATEKRDYLHELGLRVCPGRRLGRARRRLAEGHGNSVPRFHLTWGTGPEVVRVVRRARRGRRGERPGRLRLPAPRRRAGRRGRCRRRRARSGARARRRPAARGEVVARGGRRLRAARAGGDRDQRRHRRQPRPGPQALAHRAARPRPRAPDRRRARPRRRPDARRSARTPAPRSSTATGCGTTPRASTTGTRSGPTTASGSCPARRRCGSTPPASGFPAPNFPGFDTLGHAGARSWRTGYDYSWFVLTQKIIEKEFALSGSEQNPDITGKDLKLLLASRLAKGAPGPVEAFKEHGEDFVVADTIDRAGRGDEQDRPRARARRRRASRAHRSTRATASSTTTSPRTLQLMRGRQRPPLAHRQADPGRQAAHVPRPGERPADRRTPQHPDPQDPRRHRRPTSTRACSAPRGEPVPGLYAAGEVAGFGGGGVHGYNALEGTFLGGCIFSGRTAGRAVARPTDE